MVQRVVVEADGGARGNPGPAGWGAVVRDAGTGEVLVERSEAIGIATNNVAEYQGLLAGLAAAAELGAAEVEVRMDSKLVIEQMTGRWRIRHPGLRPLAAQAAGLVRRFESVNWQWVPRARNAHADRLANEAMDAAGRKPREAPEQPGPAARGSGEPAARGGEPPTRGSGEPAARGGEPPTRGSWEPPATPPLRLLLARHGETARTSARQYSGRDDVPLTPTGTSQGEALARRIAGLAPKLAAVVSSPLARCTDTAAIIARATGDPPVVTEPDLIECDFGEWEGLTYPQVRQQWPAEFGSWQAAGGTAAPGGESLRQVAFRVRRATASLRDSYPPGASVVVVSHVWPLKIMLRDALAAGDVFLHRLLLSPAGLSIVDTYPDGTLAVPTVNDTAHLPPAG